MAIKLYDYQQKLVDKARKAYADGYRAPCIVAPCGARQISHDCRDCQANYAE